MFKENKFKLELINSFPPEEVISVYRYGAAIMSFRPIIIE